MPLLGAVVLSYGLVASPETVISNVRHLTTVMPASAAKLVGEQLMHVVDTSGGKKGIGLALALAIALFGARSGAGAIIAALNIAFAEQETRGFLRFNLLALAMTAASVLFAIVAAAAAGAATLYRFGPARRRVSWEWLTPGSVLATTAWMVLTFLFGIYVSGFGHFNATYGSLSAVIVLLSWLYVSSYVFLLGAELNSELEKLLEGGPARTVPPSDRQRRAGPRAHRATRFSLRRSGGCHFRRPGAGNRTCPGSHRSAAAWAPAPCGSGRAS